ncbi:hypothetical protein Q9233_007631 [Columba guinea]|nr:hypothetical protein Q9233_007631 [Columba guinea]
MTRIKKYFITKIMYPFLYRRNTGSNRDILVGDIRSKYTPRTHSKTSTELLSELAFFGIFGHWCLSCPANVSLSLSASLTVIAVKAVASMITLSAKGKMQLTYPVFYIMIVLMATSCAFQVKFLSQAMHLYEVTAVVPINFVFFTISAIISGVIFYREFQSAALLSVFMFLIGVVVFPFSHTISLGQKLTGKVQPDYHSSRYGTLNNEDNSVKSQS